jgi:hypothetical protein
MSEPFSDLFRAVYKRCDRCDGKGYRIDPTALVSRDELPTLVWCGCERGRVLTPFGEDLTAFVDQRIAEQLP